MLFHVFVVCRNRFAVVLPPSFLRLGFGQFIGQGTFEGSREIHAGFASSDQQITANADIGGALGGGQPGLRRDNLPPKECAKTSTRLRACVLRTGSDGNSIWRQPRNHPGRPLPPTARATRRTGGRETFGGDGGCHHRHRPQIHDPASRAGSPSARDSSTRNGYRAARPSCQAEPASNGRVRQHARGRVPASCQLSLFPRGELCGCSAATER